MRELRRFAQLTFAERLLLLKTVYIVLAVRTALCLFPITCAGRVAFRLANVLDGVSPGQSIWAVRILSRYIPGATCLTQALLVQSILEQAGWDSRLEIGVRKHSGRFQAHAWVVCGKEVVIGGPDIGAYLRLADGTEVFGARG